MVRFGSAFFCTVLSLPVWSFAQTVNVTAKVETHRQQREKKPAALNTPQVVVWLTSLDPDKEAAASKSVRTDTYRLVQKDKMFHPHLLVIPVGSMVMFPNLDPFFHNVFSLFNGKRFDLGLYQTGNSREVHFNHEGVSYIFCNIHPEMSAVIVALATPYFAVSDDRGTLILRDVPAGTYRLSVWAEGVDDGQLAALGRNVIISPAHADLGAFTIPQTGAPAAHKNKFGQDYSSAEPTIY